MGVDHEGTTSLARAEARPAAEREMTRIRELIRDTLATYAPPKVWRDPGCPVRVPLPTMDGFPTRAGPQPANGGITPGYEAPDAAERLVTAARVEELLTLLVARIESLERELAALRSENWELGKWIERVENARGDRTANQGAGAA